MAKKLNRQIFFYENTPFCDILTRYGDVSFKTYTLRRSVCINCKCEIGILNLTHENDAKKAAHRKMSSLFSCFMETYSLRKMNCWPSESMRIDLSFDTLPARMSFDKRLSISLWITRFTGRAPNSGS